MVSLAHVRRATGIVVLGALALGGCGGASEPAAHATGPAPSASAPTVSAAAPDLERGEALALACRACHALGPGEPHSIGPNLYGVFGRRAGALEDFEYSDALTESGIVWTGEQLEAWLAEPDDFVRGTTMAFTGYRSAADRRALVAYLRAATAPADAGAARAD